MILLVLAFKIFLVGSEKAQSRANFFLLLRQDLPDDSTECPVNCGFSSLAGDNRLWPAVCEC